MLRAAVARQMWRELANDPFAVAAKLEGRLPSGVRRAALEVLRVVATAIDAATGLAGARALRVFALWHLGRHGDAMTVVDAADAEGRRHARLARFLLSVHRPDAALRLVGRDAAGAAVATTRIDALRLSGRLQEALQDAAASQRRHAAHGALADSARRVNGESAVLLRTWHPGAWGREPLSAVQGRVLHLVTNSLPYTAAGYTFRTHEMMLSQRSVGLDPHIVTRAGFPQHQGYLAAPEHDVVGGVTYLRLPAPLRLRIRPDELLRANVELAAEVVRKLRPAVLHAASNHWNAQVALALGHRFGIPVVYEVRGFLEETWASRQSEGAIERDFYRWSRETETWCMREADLVATLGDAMREEIVGRDVATDRVVVVPNAVDPSRFAPGPADLALRQRLGIPETMPVLGYVTTLNRYEGVDVLIGSIRVLANELNQRVCILVVGDGPDRRRLERMADDTKISDRVKFTGHVPSGSIVEYYRLIDVFVVPRLDVQVTRLVPPLKPLEAMACGRAVAASDLPALREAVRPSRTGVLFRPGDPAALAAAVAPLVADHDARYSLGQAARNWVMEERTWAQNAERYRSLYRRLGAL